MNARWLVLLSMATSLGCPNRARPPKTDPAGGDADASVERPLRPCGATYCDDQGNCRAPSPPNCR